MATGLLKFVRPGLRLQSTDVAAAAGWGVAGATAALLIVQPFDWLKKQLFDRPAADQ